MRLYLNKLTIQDRAYINMRELYLQILNYARSLARCNLSYLNINSVTSMTLTETLEATEAPLGRCYYPVFTFSFRMERASNRLTSFAFDSCRPRI